MMSKMPSSADNHTILAFDLGGSHISGALISNGECISPVSRRELREASSRVQTLAAIKAVGMGCLAHCALGAEHLIHIGMAVPNPFDHAAGTSRMTHKHAGLLGIDLRQEFGSWFGIPRQRIHFLNDADAHLMGEVACNGLKDTDRVVGIFLGTGIGSAFAVGLTVLQDGRGIPSQGEIYCLPWKGMTVEDHISSAAILRGYQAAGGRAVTVAEVADAALYDGRAHKVFLTLGRELAQVLENFTSDFRPDVVILGGGISKSANLFLPTLLSHLRKISPRFFVSRHGEEAPLVGAGIHVHEILKTC